MPVDRGLAQADVILITPDLAMGQALATVCADHAIELTVIDPCTDDLDVDGEVVVLDLLANDDAITRQAAALAKGATGRILILAGGPFGAVTDVDVAAWITPDTSVEGFVDAIADSRACLRGPTTAERTGTTGALTTRERAVLAELVAGHDNRSIASSLGISEHTVRTHLQNILAKLGLRSRSEAVSWALRSGIAAADHVQEAAS